MEIKNTTLDQSAIQQRQRAESGAKRDQVADNGREGSEDRLSISAEAGQRAEPGSGRIQDPETARGILGELRDGIAGDGGAALAAHGRVSAQVMQVLEAAA